MQSHHKNILVTEERRVRPVLSESLIWFSLLAHLSSKQGSSISLREDFTIVYTFQPNEEHIATVDMLENKDFFHSASEREGVSIHKSRCHLSPIAAVEVNRDNIILKS